MPEAPAQDESESPEEAYVENGSILWGKLAAAIVGAFVSLAGYGIATYIDMIRSGITSIVVGIGSGLAELISAPLEVGSEQVTGTWEAGAAAIEGFGILAWPVAVAVTITTFSLLLWGVSRYV